MMHSLEAKNESSITVADLFIDTIPFMAWVQFKSRVLQMVYPMNPAVFRSIEHISGQAIYIISTAFQFKIAKHMIE